MSCGIVCKAGLLKYVPVAILIALFCGVVHAQSNTGTVYGKVSDKQGLPVVGATVTLRNTDLATARTVLSDAAGEFSISGLVPGAYTVESQKKSLTLRHPIRLTVGLGSSTQVAIELNIPVVKQGTSVSARAPNSEGNTTTPPINEGEASISSFFAGTVVTYLPNRDRQVNDFNQLAENSHESEDGSGTVVDGQRTNALLTQMDGVSANDPLLGGLSGIQDGAFVVPQTVVREFQMVSSGQDAGAGQTNGGLVSVATKEGSNKLHGEAFYTARPATLSSADAFGNGLDNFQNVFGASEGGALRKDKSFFYAGFEKDYLRAPSFTLFEPQAPGIAVPAMLASLQSQILENDSPLGIFGRVDQVLNGSNTLNAELAYTRIHSTNVGDGSSRSIAVSANTASVSGQSVWSRLGLTTVTGPHSVNQAVGSWSDDHRDRAPNSTAPEFVINGFGVLGGDALGAHLYTSRQLELSDVLSMSRGTSLLTIGATFDNDPAYEQREENLNGRFDYNSLTAYINNVPRRFQQTFITGNVRYNAAVNQFALYANGHLQLRKNLTLTAGLRWAAQWNPQPSQTNASITQTQKIPSDLTQWQPRVGLAWKAGKSTVVRISSGLYTATTPATYLHRVFADNGIQTVTADSYFDPQLLTLTAATTSSPHSLAAPPAGLTTPAALVEGIDPRFRNPRSFQSAVSVDQTLSPKLTLRGGYLHSETWRLERALDENLNPPTFNASGVPVFPTARPITGVGRLLVNQSGAHSDYNSVSISAISQISRRTQLTVNYTISKTRDDDSYDNPYGIQSAVDLYNLPAEHAYSSLDMRNVVNVGAIFNLPVGLKLNPMFVAHSGAPYTALIGFDTQNDANDFNDRTIVNGAEAPRNLYRQPAFSNADVRIVKDFTLKGQGHHLDLFMDVFNVLGASNRNFGPDQISLFGTAAAPVYSGGQALFAPGGTRVGGPREFQFTARLVGF
jgi:hypothetical protein